MNIENMYLYHLFSLDPNDQCHKLSPHQQKHQKFHILTGSKFFKDSIFPPMAYYFLPKIFKN